MHLTCLAIENALCVAEAAAEERALATAEGKQEDDIDPLFNMSRRVYPCASSSASNPMHRARELEALAKASAYVCARDAQLFRRRAAAMCSQEQRWKRKARELTATHRVLVEEETRLDEELAALRTQAQAWSDAENAADAENDGGKKGNASRMRARQQEQGRDKALSGTPFEQAISSVHSLHTILRELGEDLTRSTLRENIELAKASSQGRGPRLAWRTLQT